MRSGGRAVREVFHTLAVIVAAMLAAALLALWWMALMGAFRQPEPDPDPGVTVSDADRIFREHVAVFDRAMDVLWRNHEAFQWSFITRIGSREELERLRQYAAIPDEEWQAVQDMVALLEPEGIVYYEPMTSYGGRVPCSAWGFAVSYRVADEEAAWADGWVNLRYVYARCVEEDHEGQTLACGMLRALVSRASLNADTWTPLGAQGWHRITQWKERRKSP